MKSKENGSNEPAKSSNKTQESDTNEKGSAPRESEAISIPEMTAIDKLKLPKGECIVYWGWDTYLYESLMALYFF